MLLIREGQQFFVGSPDFWADLLSTDLAATFSRQPPWQYFPQSNSGRRSIKLNPLLQFFLLKQHIPNATSIKGALDAIDASIDKQLAPHISRPVSPPADVQCLNPCFPVRHPSSLQQKDTAWQRPIIGKGQDFWPWSQRSKTTWQSTGELPGWPDTR